MMPGALASLHISMILDDMSTLEIKWNINMDEAPTMQKRGAPAKAPRMIIIVKIIFILSYLPFK